ncbi:MAG: flagellar biosynthesis protein FliQ [Treponema sp.]|uniref:flagellar biosynthesis protein FliQ n=1 Tax=Treponema sp. TaxID=166 RepID=UPI0025D24B5F|nr:flagellar biosynthesis protein FliQ [Treponema sp.]MBQ9623447.1 flagellar biosynthesis protein FliQ [Treponema sp.]MBR0495755.1 flagellar biosynthesis protein FliQ [Treponema sp.]
MSVGMIVNLMRGAVFQVFILCAPVLGAALVIGLIVAIFQATTSIQEQTLTFLPKMLVILVVLALLGGWMFGMMGNYTVNLFSQIKNLAR